MADNPPADASVVVLVLDSLATARIHCFLSDDDFVVAVFELFAVDKLPAGCLLVL